MKISKIQSKEILDSKGVPTLETTLTLDTGESGVASVASGSSTGTHEAHELRDSDPLRYQGKGVLIAVKNVNEIIAHHMANKEFQDQKLFDAELLALDGTDDKSGLGANTLLSASMAYCRAVSQHKKVPLYKYIQEISNHNELEPVQMNILVMEGGKHGNWATDIQEYMIIPQKEKYSNIIDGIEVAKNIVQSIRDILSEKMYDTNLGMEGGFAPKELKSNKESLEIIMQGIEKAGYKPGDEVCIAIDVAASEFFGNGTYNIKREDRLLNPQEWLNYLTELIKPFPITFLEDPMSEDEWDSWTKVTELLGNNMQIVGDDLLTTNIQRIKKGIELKAANSVIIKPNQIGTVTETIDAINHSESAGLKTIISHRSGETEDSFISDLVAGTKSTQTKFGCPTKKERLSKYYRLMEIYSGK